MKNKQNKQLAKKTKNQPKKKSISYRARQFTKGTIFISGYWPPTNTEQPDGMLNQFKSSKRGTLGEYIIENYKDTGYRLVTIATEFPDNVEPTSNWGGGTGFWTVDYPLTSYTFWKLMKAYTPCALMTTSRNTSDKRWVMEIGATNLPRNSWTILSWNQDRPPYIGGSDSDPALPNAGCNSKRGNPPDATVNQNTIRYVTAEVSVLQQIIINVLNKKFTAEQLVSEKDTEVQGTGSDSYVSAFVGYHAVWYNAWSAACRVGWHTHVGFEMTAETASKAIKLQLHELIKWLDSASSS
ncbi:MAG: hypothetical protein AAGE59_28435 [Cyanobacteria bacterium P01_F01_bin.86]